MERQASTEGAEVGSITSPKKAELGFQQTSNKVAASSKGRDRPRRAESAPYARRKIQPSRPSRAINDIYINRKTEFSAQLARCHKLLDQGLTELNIHGLGAAIHRAINLALQIRETSSLPLDISASTSTVELQDELEPLDDDEDFRLERRSCSAIHIRLYHPTSGAVKPVEMVTP